MLRASRICAALVMAFLLVGLAVSASSHAQGIAVPPAGALTIPDNPCITPEERRQLQTLSDEHDVLFARLTNLIALLGQLSEELKNTTAQKH